MPHCALQYQNIQYYTQPYNTIPQSHVLYAILSCMPNCALQYQNIQYCTKPRNTIPQSHVLYAILCCIPYCALQYQNIQYCTKPHKYHTIVTCTVCHTVLYTTLCITIPKHTGLYQTTQIPYHSHMYCMPYCVVYPTAFQCCIIPNYMIPYQTIPPLPKQVFMYCMPYCVLCIVCHTRF